MTRVSARRLLGIAFALILGTAPTAALAETGAVSLVNEGEQEQTAMVALVAEDDNQGTGNDQGLDDGSATTGDDSAGDNEAGSGQDDPVVINPEPEPEPDPEPEPAAGTFSKGGKLYYRFSDGTILKGLGWRKCEGSWYYVSGSDGSLATGWKKLSGKWYWLDRETGVMATGIVDVDGTKYLLASSGAMLTGWQKYDGSWYYLNSSGAMAIGWKKLGGVWYYLEPKTGKMATGWIKVGNKHYLMSSSGAMQTGWKKLNGKWYYLNSSGDMATGWKKLGKTWYWLDTKTGVMATGWVKDKGEWYYLNSNGAMATGWKKLGNVWYYLKSSGALATGWTKVGGKWYWLDEETGAMYTGWLKQNGTWYWLASNGAAAQNEIKVVNGLGYAFDSSCACHYGGVNVPASSLNKKQQDIVNACRKVPSPGKGLCAAWVTQVFEYCGYASLNLDACDMANQYCKTSDLSKLKPGMMIAVRSHSHTWAGSIWGHVCIYIGDGKVMDNAGTIRIVDLGSWLYWYGDTVTPKWGWYDNKSLL